MKKGESTYNPKAFTIGRHSLSQQVENFRKKAESHWRFIEPILRAKYTIKNVQVFDKKLVKYLYIESMLHGFKHGKERARYMLRYRGKE